MYCRTMNLAAGSHTLRASPAHFSARRWQSACSPRSRRATWMCSTVSPSTASTERRSRSERATGSCRANSPGRPKPRRQRRFDTPQKHPAPPGVFSCPRPAGCNRRREVLIAGEADEDGAGDHVSASAEGYTAAARIDAGFSGAWYDPRRARPAARSPVR